MIGNAISTVRGSAGSPQAPGSRPEHGAAREVLHLALAVDRRVGDHGHRLLEVVRQVLALGREAGQRPVVAQRADRLLARGRHLLHELHVLALPAEAAQHAVLHLHRLGRAGRGVARDLRALERSADGDHLCVAVHRLLARARHPALPGQPLQLDVLAQLRLALLAVEADHHLLAGGERLGLRHRLLDRHHARLGGERVGAGGLDQPERPQAQRVHREDALVAVTGQQRHRSLRERAEGLAQVHVERAQLLGQLLDLVHDRRQHQLERLHERQRAAVHERLHRAVEVLRVGAVRVDRHVQHARLLAQLRDRVDLAVVAEHRERLNALEGGPGVRGVAVVADHRGRLGPLVEQVRVVLAEHGRRAHHLVDAGLGGERGHVHVQLLLQRHGQLEAEARLAGQAADLPEDRLLLAGRGAEGGRVHHVLALGQHAQPEAAHDVAGPRLRLLGVAALARDEDVADHELRVERQVRGVSAGADLLGPDLARDVQQHAAAVTLAVDVTGAVEHLLERGERGGDRLVARGRVLLDGRIERAGVLVLHGRRRTARTIPLR